MKKFLFAIFSTLFMMNCSQEDLHENNILKNETQVENNDKLLIEKNIVNLNPQDAANVALLFRSKHNGLDSRTLDDVKKIRNKDSYCNG